MRNVWVGISAVMWVPVIVAMLLFAFIWLIVFEPGREWWSKLVQEAIDFYTDPSGGSK